MLLVLAIPPTAIRVYLRCSNRLWWWDDTFAVISFAFLPIFVAGAFLLTKLGHGSTEETRVLGYYLTVCGYYIATWAGKTCILFTVIRITPWPTQRKILFGFAGLFFFFFALVLIESIWRCEITNSAWKNNPKLHCKMGKAVSITLASTTFIADSLLVLSPLLILRNTTVESSIRFRLVFIFSLSVIPMAIAIAHAVMVVVAPIIWEATLAIVEMFATLTVGHASVLLPALLRYFKKDKKYEDPHYAGHTRNPGNSGALSTVMFNRMGLNNDDIMRIDIALNDLERHAVDGTVEEVENNNGNVESSTSSL